MSGWGVFLVVLCFLALGLWFVYKQTARILSPKHKRKPLDFFPDEAGLKYEEIRFKTEDDILIKGWFLPCEGSKKTIILMHGWGMNRSDILKNTYFLQQQANLLYFDFRGLGESGGVINSIGYLETRDLAAAVNYLRAAHPEAAQSIGLYGLSLGAVVGIYGAAEDKTIKCVAAEAAYYSFKRVVARWAWVKNHIPFFPVIPAVLYFMRRKLSANPEGHSPVYNVHRLAGRPVFFIYGSKDKIVPLPLAKRLYREAEEPKELWVVEGASHDGSAVTAGAEYKERLGNFFKQYL